MHKKPYRLDQLTFTRFVAATAIVIYHFGLFTFPFNSKIVSRAFNNANLFVSYFFILSGFIMIIAYNGSKKLDVKKYYINRLSRIYPIYVLALLLVVALPVTERPGFAGFLSQLLLVQGWIPKFTLMYNYPGWSLSAEVFFYLAFPLFYNYIYFKYSFKTVTLCILLFWLISQCSFCLLSIYGNQFVNIPYSGEQRTNFIFYLPLFHLNEFLAGNAAGLLFLNIKARKISALTTAFKITLFAVYISTVIAIYSTHNIKSVFLMNLHNGFLAVTFIPFMLWISLTKTTWVKHLAARPLVFLGNISYEMYILQFPVYLVVGKIGSKLKMSNNTWFYSSFIVLLVASAVCHLYLEKPLLKVIRKYCS